jgi:hypothetical protein
VPKFIKEILMYLLGVGMEGGKDKGWKGYIFVIPFILILTIIIFLMIRIFIEN